MEGKNKEYVPLYGHNEEYARKHDELMLYSKSYLENLACKNTIERGIELNYDGAHLNTDIILDVILIKYGVRRINYVLANTIQTKLHENRFSTENKEWAKRFSITPDHSKDGYDRNHDFTVNSHPGLINLLITAYRQKIDTKLMT